MKEKSKSVLDTVCMIIQQADGWLLQVRDNKDGIWNPGKTSHWGGRFEPEDEGIATNAAFRELYEETGLGSDQVKIELFSVEYYERTSPNGIPKIYRCHCFLVKVIDDSPMYIHEGQGSMLVPFNSDYHDDKWNIHPFTIQLLFTLRDRSNEAKT